MEKDISELYSEVAYWHGTGRYKYGAKGEVIDILKGLLAEGGLVPHDDDWDFKLGNIKSISLARSRMYAKLYAVMYMPDGKRIEGEYGSRWLWYHYFFDTARLMGLIQGIAPWKAIVDYKKKIVIWVGKITKQPARNIFSVFDKGTDIVENYPILIGIKKGSIQPVLGSRIFRLHEVRSKEIVGFSGITHIEIPRSKIAETSILLREAGVDIPIISFEEGESFCRRFSFFELVSGKPLKQKQ